MPSKSKAQHNLMAMVAHDPKAAKRVGISQSVGRDYVEADKGHKFGSGGTMKNRKFGGESKAMMKKEIAFMKKKGAPKSMIKHEKEEYGMKRGSKTRKFEYGGPVPTPPPPPPPSRMAPPDPAPAPLPPVPTQPSEVERRMRGTRENMSGGRRMAKGGMAKSGGSYRRAADGVASKGKTKGKMVKMNMGGKC